MAVFTSNININSEMFVKNRVEMLALVDEIHRLKEYHGDLHAENIIVQRYGLGFDLKVLDLYHWDMPKKENIQDDICDMIKIFYDAIGGQKHYAKHPQVVKDICCGLKKSLILGVC